MVKLRNTLLAAGAMMLAVGVAANGAIDAGTIGEPLSTHEAQSVAGGECYDFEFDEYEYGCDIETKNDSSCWPIYFFGSGGPIVSGEEPAVAYCYECGDPCGACNAVIGTCDTY